MRWWRRNGNAQDQFDPTLKSFGADRYTHTIKVSSSDDSLFGEGQAQRLVPCRKQEDFLFSNSHSFTLSHNYLYVNDEQYGSRR